MARTACITKTKKKGPTKKKVMAAFAAISLTLSACGAKLAPLDTARAEPRCQPWLASRLPPLRGLLASSLPSSAAAANTGRGPSVLRVMGELERQRLAGLHKGAFLCSWQGASLSCRARHARTPRTLARHARRRGMLVRRATGTSGHRSDGILTHQTSLVVSVRAGDPYNTVAAAKAADPHKAQTNALFCEAVAGLGAFAGDDAGWVLVLDAAQATTCQHLLARGIPLSRVLVPNVFTSTVAALRKKGVANAFCCDVEDLLEQVRVGVCWHI